MTCVLGYITVPTREEAIALGRDLVASRLAACANILPGMMSIYRWQGAIEESPEVVLVVKTTSDLAEEAAARIAARHSYECPSVVFLDIAQGHAPYLQWIAGETGRTRARRTD
ncbi:divalent-cation tolerance protein CutA [Marinivivus vitaminiproducens]|uniref:divalent-cation tolerance protein CutA n=1 Tax=Marinivivus vitaminiproducens TaxID=3035935 RepID=UPI0027A60BB3|nr:divalent-cation tolerance protein CutA [Geminicoccaceae bacterium SCSIO 64248]